MSPAVPVRSRSSVRRRYSARERPACLALASMAASTSSGTSRIRMSVNGYPLSLRIPHDIIGRTWTRSRSESSGRGSYGHGIPAFSTCGRSFSPASGPESSRRVWQRVRTLRLDIHYGRHSGRSEAVTRIVVVDRYQPRAVVVDGPPGQANRRLPLRTGHFGQGPGTRREGTHHMGAGQGAGIGGRAR